MRKEKRPQLDIPYTLNLLRNMGFKVTISHVRDFGAVAAIEDRSQIMDFENAKWNGFMSRPEFWNAYKEDRIFYMNDEGDLINVPCDEDLKFGDFILPTGGWTYARIESPSGEVFEGKRNFGRTEHFVKRDGLRGAFQRAYGKLRLSEQTFDLEVHAHDEEDMTEAEALASM